MDTKNAPSPPGDTLRYRRIVGYIETHLDDRTLGIRSIGDRFGMSRSGLQRLFQADGGVMTYIRRSRTRVACLRLRQRPALRLTALFHDLGFSNERQFQRAFHADLGMSPSRWRRAHLASRMA